MATDPTLFEIHANLLEALHAAHFLNLLLNTKTQPLVEGTMIQLLESLSEATDALNTITQVLDEIPTPKTKD